MPKDPAFLFYPKDFVVRTILWSHEERGKFIFLLCLQHQNGHIKKSEFENVCGNSENVSEQFVKDENECFYNKMLEEVIDKRSTALDTHRECGKLGGRPKKETKQKPNGFDLDNQMETKSVTKNEPNENHSGNGNGNETVYVNETGNGCTKEIEEVSEEEEMFNVFWSEYPKKVAKPQCLTAFKRIPHLKELFPKIMASLFQQKNSNDWRKEHGQYIPNPLTWIHQQRWEYVQDPTPEDVFRSYGLPF